MTSEADDDYSYFMSGRGIKFAYTSQNSNKPVPYDNILINHNTQFIPQDGAFIVRKKGCYHISAEFTTYPGKDLWVNVTKNTETIASGCSGSGKFSVPPHLPENVVNLNRERFGMVRMSILEELIPGDTIQLTIFEGGAFYDDPSRYTKFLARLVNPVHSY